MIHRVLASLILCATATSAFAQDAADPLTQYLRRSYAAVARNLEAVVDLMPEQEFGFRPVGAVKEVRTFAEIVAHVIEVNTFVCAMGDGRRDSTQAPPGAPLQKARLTASLKAINTRCTAYLASLTDATLPQVITSGTGASQVQSVRGNAAVFAISHSNEHYGNLVTYLRANGLVPPAAAAQVAPISRARQ